MVDSDCDIATLCRQLHETYESPTPTYAQVWSAVASGRIPAMRVGRRLLIRQADAPRVAEHFELQPKKPAAAA